MGTTNSCVAVLDGGTPLVLPNAEGARTTPSLVAFNDAHERLVGQQAKRQAVINPTRTIQRVKRLMGRKYRDADIQELGQQVGYQLVEHVNGDCWVQVNGQAFAPAEISALILQKMRLTAEDFFGEEIRDAVITVPAYFSDAQRQATRVAGKIAGLNVLRIINEPTAAALAYGVQKDKDANLLVFDLGGGTFDVSVLTVRGGLFEVVATSGDNHLGGEDFDAAIMAYLLDAFEAEHGMDLSGDAMALQRLRGEAETAKCELSTLRETSINLPFFAVNDSGAKHLTATLTRAQLEEICKPLLDRLEAPARRALQDANLPGGKVDEVLLVGGMTRMPAVQQLVERIFGNKPSRGVNPDEAVAIGASLQAGILAGEVQEFTLMDVTPLSLGLRAKGNRMSKVIERNTAIPVRATKIYTTTEDNQNTVILQVLQGESEIATDNSLIGTFSLTDLPPKPAGRLRIEVAFDIDRDGIVNVSATDTETGNEQSITIEDGSGMSEAEIQRAMQRVGAMTEAAS